MPGEIFHGDSTDPPAEGGGGGLCMKECITKMTYSQEPRRISQSGHMWEVTQPEPCNPADPVSVVLLSAAWTPQ